MTLFEVSFFTNPNYFKSYFIFALISFGILLESGEYSHNTSPFDRRAFNIYILI